MTKDIKVISFDLDDTLWPITEVINRAEKVYMDWLAASYPQLHAQGVWRLLPEKQAQVKQGPGGHCITQVRKKSLLLLLIEAGIGQKEAEQASEAAFAVFFRERNCVRPFDGAKAMLTTLREHVHLASLTNGNADVEQTHLSNCFDLNLNPQRVGVRKPDAKMFLSICKHFEVLPDQVLHVGDHYEEDVKGAKAVGLEAVWILHTAEIDALWPKRRAQAEQWLADHKREPVAPLVNSINDLRRYLETAL